MADPQVPPFTYYGGLLREALRELDECGGAKPWVYCRFDFHVAWQIVDAGWATIDAAPVPDAYVRLTPAGRTRIAEG